jgi:hypothetical protein
MRRDEMAADEAFDTIADLRRRVRDGENPEELLHDELGLESDYIFDLM